MNKRTSHENYVLLQIYAKQMKSTEFTPNKLIRKLRPFCKTYKVSDNLFYLRLRNSKLGLSIHVCDLYAVVTSSTNEFVSYHFHLSTCKSFLKKLLKHNLLKP